MSHDIRRLLCLKCCPKCGGAMFRECDIHGCDVECLQCGYVMPQARLEALLGPKMAEMILNPGRKREDPVQEGKPRRRGRKVAE